MNKYYKVFFRYHDRYEEILLRLIRWKHLVTLKYESKIVLFEVKLISTKGDDLIIIHEKDGSWSWKGNDFQKYTLSIDEEELNAGSIFEADNDDEAKLIFEVSECMG